MPNAGKKICSKSSKMVLIHNKEDNKDLKNYRSISLLTNVLSLHKILALCLNRVLDENRPIEQAGVRSRYSVIDCIHTVNQLKEKCAEYQEPLCLAFVGYDKAFGSVELKAILISLEKQGIDKGCIDALTENKNGASTVAMLHRESNESLIRKGRMAR